MTSWRQQVRVLVRHHLTVMRRRWGITALQVVAPWLFIVLLVIVRRASMETSTALPHPPTTSLFAVPKCSAGESGKCVSYIYFPSNATTDAIMNHFARRQDLKMGEIGDYDSDVWAGTDINAVINWLETAPNTTGYVIGFINATNLGMYELWFNATMYSSSSSDRYDLLRTSILAAVNEAILSYVARDTHPGGGAFKFSMRGYPELDLTTSSSPDATSELGLVFFYCSLMFSFAVLLNQMVYYKHTGVKGMFKLMGVRDSAYLVSWLVPGLIAALYNALIIIIMGSILNLPMFRAHWAVVFLAFLLISVANVVFAMFFSTIITDYRVSVLMTGAIFGFGLMFAFTFYDGFVYEYYEKSYQATMRIIFFQFFPIFNFMRIYCDIFKVTRLTLDSKTGMYVEGPGFQWEDLTSSPDATHDGWHDIDVPPTVDSIYLLVMNIAVYVVLTWYTDGVRKNKNGRGRSCCFCLSPRYYRMTRPAAEAQLPSSAFFTFEQYTTGDVAEESDRVLQNRLTNNHTVRILALTKVFAPRCRGEQVQALKGTTFAAERGQVLAVIGPAGAGKTTVFNILSGLIATGSGEAYINDASITRSLDWVQSSIGVCQQYDILLKGMTVIDHLKLTAELRGIPAADVARDITEKLRELDLTSFADVAVENLSGGTRRRLNVAMACLGDSQLILLDEPTSGLDPLNRSRVYAMLDRLKQNRTVIISTHSMEDADKFADKIVALDRGTVKSVGHPVYLKNKFGAGYKISVTTSDEEVIKQSLMAIVPTLKVFSEGGSLVFSVPPDQATSMPALCAAMESAANVESWGISQSSLVDLFVKLSSPAALSAISTPPSVTPSVASTGTVSSIASPTSPVTISSPVVESQTASTPPPRLEGNSFLFGWRAVASKNWALQRRRRKTNCFLIVMTVVMFLIIGPINLLQYRDSYDYPDFDYGNVMGDNTYKNPCAPTWTDSMLNYRLSVSYTDCPDYGVVPLATRAPTGVVMRHKTKQVHSRAEAPVGDERIVRPGSMWFVNPTAGAKLGTWDGVNGTGVFAQFGQLVTIGWQKMMWDYGTQDEIDDKITDLEVRVNTFMRDKGCDDGWSCDGVDDMTFIREVWPQAVIYASTLDPASLTMDVTISVPDRFTSPTQAHLSGELHYYNPVDSIIFELSMYLQNGFAEALTDTGLHFDIGFRPFAHAKYIWRLGNYRHINAIGSMAQFMFPCAMSFLLAVFVENLVYEKEQRLTEMMKMMGLRTGTYYLVNYAFSYAVYCASALIFIILGLAWQFRFFTATNPVVYILLLLLWGHTICSLAFFLSALFSSTRRAVAVTYIVLFALIITQMILNTSVYDDDEPPFLLLLVLPPLSFYRGIYLISRQLGYCTKCEPLGFTDAFSGPMGAVNAALILSSLVYGLVGIYLQFVMPRQYGVKRSPLFCLNAIRRRVGLGETTYARVGDLVNEPGVEDGDDPLTGGINDAEMGSVAAPAPGGEDEDVANMRQHVARRQYAANCPLVLEGLTKAFTSDQVALKDLTLAIENGECFCLLGPNGAGKSTLLNVLTGLIEPTSGSAYVCGYNITREIQKAYMSVGVCPQDDAIWPELTVRDHLLFYARLTGLRKPLDALHVDQRMAQFGLTTYAGTRVGTLSRGDIRRLSVAIAFTGWRRVIFLDEPTNGLDPASRLPIWRMIESVKSDHCIVMNTHSMDEAETLATTVAILSQGKLLCIGTRDHLRSKFGKGYRLEISAVNAERLGEAEVFVRSVAPGAELISNVAVHSVFEVPRENLRLSKVFEQMQSGAAGAGIAQWTITQSSLDEVFRKVVASDEAAHAARA